MNPWLLLAVMSLTVFIVTHLIVNLDFPPVLWLRDRVVGGWRPLTMAEQGAPMSASWRCQSEVIDGEVNRWIDRTPWVPFFFAELMSCPWCVGAWIALAVTAGASFTVSVPSPVLMGFATWALGSLLASRDWA